MSKWEYQIDTGTLLNTESGEVITAEIFSEKFSELEDELAERNENVKKLTKALTISGNQLNEAATLMLVHAKLIHSQALNHEGKFEDCDAPVCKAARALMEHADVKAAEVFAEKEASYQKKIEELSDEGEYKDEMFRAIRTETSKIESDYPGSSVVLRTGSIEEYVKLGLGEVEREKKD